MEEAGGKVNNMQPLSSSQEIFCPNAAAFSNGMWNVGVVLPLFGRSDEKVNSALNRLLFSQKALWIRVIEENGAIFCLCREPEEFHAQEIKLCSAQETESFLSREINRPFLPGEPLFRCSVINCRGKRSLLLVLHHLICDGNAGTLLAGLFSEELPHSDYLEYLEKERSYRRSEMYEKDRAFWKEVLSAQRGFSVFPAIPDSSAGYAAGAVPFRLLGSLRRFCEKNNFSISSALHAAMCIALAKTEGKSSFCVGLPLSTRLGRADNNTLGMYLHMIPEPFVLDSASYFEQVARCFEFENNAYRHVYYSSADIQRDMRLSPLYDVVMEYHRQPFVSKSVRVLRADSVSSNLEIHFEEDRGVLRVLYAYRKSGIGTEKITELDREFVSCLEKTLKEPDAPANGGIRYSLLAGAKKEIGRSSLFSRFYETAMSARERVCIRSEDEELSFGEFSVYAMRMAEKLKIEGIKKNEPVALCLDRSVEMYAAVYGILGAGGCFVPVSPKAPDEKKRHILNDCGAGIVITQKEYLPSLRTVCSAKKLICAEEVIRSEALSAAEFEPEVSEASDFVYIIYTSGTTGNPKGAVNRFESVMNRLQWMRDEYGFSADDTILQKTNYAFDVSVWEILLWGIYGGSVYILPDGEECNIPEIVRSIERGRVSWIHFVPGVYRLFARYLDADPEQTTRLSSLRHVFLSGEELDAQSVETVYKLCPKLSQHNLYGPTECAIDVSFYDCSRPVPEAVPIGRPIDNTVICVRDEMGSLCPIGQAGELCIGGVSVGAGYLNLPERTAGSFVDDPALGRLYRSGDLARIDENGELIFLGRLDDQLKINGIRTEPREIELAMRMYPGVTDAAVIAEKDGFAVRLHIFYTGSETDPQQIRAFLREKLGSAIVPADITRTESFLYTENTKLDRAAMLALLPEAKSISSGAETNGIERDICEAIARELKIDGISRDTDIFETGAGSLNIAALLCLKLFEGLSPDDFFRCRTPVGLAECLRAGKRSETLISLCENGEADELWLFFPYAGGSSLSYAPLTEAMNRRACISALYCPIEANPESAADELISKAAGRRICVYSHCIGAAPALRLIAETEKRGAAVTRFFAGGMVLPDRGGKPSEFLPGLPDFALRALLEIAGIRQSISDEVSAKLLASFRTDIGYCNAILSGFNDTVHVRPTLILSRKDIFTPDYGKAVRRWRQYCEEEPGLVYLDAPTHYFIMSHCEQTAEILLGERNTHEKSR